MVDLMGIEPMASRMRTERSPTELQTHDGGASGDRTRDTTMPLSRDPTSLQPQSVTSDVDDSKVRHDLGCGPRS